MIKQKECIRLLTKEEYIKVRKIYNHNWHLSTWSFCKDHTCYIPEENCFITLEKAIKLNFKIKNVDD